MSITAKLERLNGRSLSVRHTDSQVCAARSSGMRTSPEVLAAALHARVNDDGVVIREQRFELSARNEVARDLTALPEVFDQPDGDWIYIDTETTGLSGGVGNLAFMVGVARYSGPTTLVVRQYLLGGFGAEAAMLRNLVEWIGDRAVLVSYNGKCFDLPLLTARLSLYRIATNLSSLPHLDLMYSVRRAYRKAWPDCRLQTVECRRLGVYRVGDLPGSAAPAAWQAWLRNGASGALAGVLRHNYQDVVSLALLHHASIDDYAGTSREDADAGAIGRAWLAAGQQQNAIRIWEQGLARLAVTDRLELAAAYRRVGRWSDALCLWHQLHAAGVTAAALELSKYYEHRARDYATAIALLISCDTDECASRSRRLRLKLGRNLNLPLGSGHSDGVGKGDEVTCAVRDREATTQHTIASGL